MGFIVDSNQAINNINLSRQSPNDPPKWCLVIVLFMMRWGFMLGFFYISDQLTYFLNLE